MSKIDQGEYMFADTLRPADIEKDKEIKTRITEVKQIGTKYGDKRVAVLETGKQAFLNAMSLQNLVEAFGNETDKWVGQEVILGIEISERTQGKPSIVVTTEELKKK